jgi:hypothetical protein
MSTTQDACTHIHTEVVQGHEVCSDCGLDLGVELVHEPHPAHDPVGGSGHYGEPQNPDETDEEGGR